MQGFNLRCHKALEVLAAQISRIRDLSRAGCHQVNAHEETQAMYNKNGEGKFWGTTASPVQFS